ncbi:hypothetical protein [Kitasatospora sp. NPDC058478]|uniref:hypothetical protein n=1 Tax=Kitasatospora sp. NPDC058478 TaxID=3346520 RepID=UPI0036629E73
MTAARQKSDAPHAGSRGITELQHSLFDAHEIVPSRRKKKPPNSPTRPFVRFPKGSPQLTGTGGRAVRFVRAMIRSLPRQGATA